MFFEKSFIDAVSKEINKSKTNTEIETRFGEYKTGKFNPYISKEKFEKIQKKLNNIENNKIEKTQKEYLQVYYPNNVRHNQIYEDGQVINEIWEEKELVKNINNEELNIRVSFSNEKIIETPEDFPEPLYFRDKKTTTYNFQNFVYFEMSTILIYYFRVIVKYSYL